MIKIVLFSFFLLFSCKKEKSLADFGGDFTLNSSKGDWKLSTSNGKVRILYFGFTHCPDVCPMSLSKLKRALKKVSKKNLAEVLPVFISVDYKRDTPETVQKYTSFFSENFIGLTGSEEQIRKVTKQYGVFFEFTPLKDSAMGYTVDHTSRFFLINKEGEYANSFSNIQGNEEFLTELNKLIGE